MTGGHLRAPTGNLRAALGETLEFCLWKLGEVRAAPFRLAVRFFLAELSRTKVGRKLSANFPSPQLGLQVAHRQMESCCVYFTQFPKTEIKGLSSNDLAAKNGWLPFFALITVVGDRGSHFSAAVTFHANPLISTAGNWMVYT